MRSRERFGDAPSTYRSRGDVVREAQRANFRHAGRLGDAQTTAPPTRDWMALVDGSLAFEPPGLPFGWASAQRRWTLSPR